MVYPSVHGWIKQSVKLSPFKLRERGPGMNLNRMKLGYLVASIVSLF